jgi:hypothetical protein
MNPVHTFPTKPTPWSEVIEKLTVTQLVKKFPAIYETQSFISVFTRAAGHYPDPDESSPHLPNLTAYLSPWSRVFVGKLIVT